MSMLVLLSLMVLWGMGWDVVAQLDEAEDAVCAVEGKAADAGEKKSPGQ